MMHALVTGAGGFIGSHLTEVLLARGSRVRAMVRYTSRGAAGFLDRIDAPLAANMVIVRGDLRDPDFMDRAVRGVDTVFHLGALIGIPYSYEAVESYIQTNVVGTLNVLRAVGRHGVKRLVQTSTSEVYGSSQYEPMDEQHPLHPQSPYAASKVASDQLALSFARSYGTPVVVLRPFNTYGPRQSARAVIPAIVSQALVSDTVRLGSTAPVRDFLHVRDTCAAFVAAAEASGIEGSMFNCAAGRGVSIGEVVDLVGQLTGKRLIVVEDKGRVRPATSEVTRLVGSAKALSERTGWKPAVEFKDGLQSVIDWVTSHADEYDPSTYAT